MSGKSKEEIAFELVSKLKGVGVWGENNRAAILDMYAECLEATSGLRSVNGKAPMASQSESETAPVITETPMTKVEPVAPPQMAPKAAPHDTQPVQQQPAQQPIPQTLQPVMPQQTQMPQSRNLAQPR